MAWTPTKIQALVLPLRSLPPSKPGLTVKNVPAVYGGSASFSARQNQSGVQTFGRR